MAINTLNHRTRPTLATITGLAAAGTSQATAAPLFAAANHEFTTVAVGSGAILPAPSLPSGPITITNAGAAALAIYPPPGGMINNGAVNAPTSLAVGAIVAYWPSSPTNYYPSTSAAGNATGYGPGAARPNFGVIGDLFIPSDGVMTSVDTGTSWAGLNPFGAQFTPPPTLAGWSQIQPTLQTLTDVPGGGIGFLVPPNGVNNAVCGIVRSPTNPALYTATVCLSFMEYLSVSPSVGLIVTDGTKLISWFYAGGNTEIRMFVQQYTTNANLSTNVISPNAPRFVTSQLWLKLVQDGAHRTYWFSTNGIVWIQAYQEASNTFLTESQIGIGFNTYAAGTDVFRTISGLVYSWTGA